MPAPAFSEVFKQALSAYWHSMLDLFKFNFSKPSELFSNPFFTVIFICLFCFMLEHILPKKKNYPVTGRKGFFTDLFYVVFIDIITYGFGFYALITTIEWFIKFSFHTENPEIFAISKLPVWVQFLLLFILVDFSQWLAHFLLHRVNFLWQFHKIHHAQETLGFASTRHFHFFEFFILKPFLFIPMKLIGYSAHDYFLFHMWFGYFLTFYSHCNIKLSWGFLDYIIINPETHYWHHSKNIPGRYGVNFSSILNVWDLMFGTFYLPKDKNLQPELGLPNNNVPESFLGQLVFPFKAVFSKKVRDPRPHKKKKK
ncbi:MAG: sterol desaturase family protein [Bacteroidia bacterium]|nr:sterol desaturase family protein [Bacteroidia bacterium]